MGIKLSDLSPWARRKALEKYQKEQEKDQKRAAVPKLEDVFDSKLERDYYLAEILPRVRSGEISTVSLHERFELLPASSYCGIRLPAAQSLPARDTRTRRRKPATMRSLFRCVHDTNSRSRLIARCAWKSVRITRSPKSAQKRPRSQCARK